MEFTARPMRGMLTVAADAVASDEGLTRWIDRAKAFVVGLPANG